MYGLVYRLILCVCVCVCVCVKVFGSSDAKRKERDRKFAVDDSTDGPEHIGIYTHSHSQHFLADAYCTKIETCGTCVTISQVSHT